MTPISWDLITYFYIGSILLSSVRIVIGPTASDRLVGLNMVAAQVLAIMVVFAVKEELSVYLDVALVYDLFGFVGLLAITRYLGRKGEE